MNILFIAPRFHTNQYYTIKNLLKKFTLYLHCIKKGKTENYDDIRPIIIPQCSIVKNFFFYYNFFKKKKIDLIVIRFYRRPFLYFFLIFAKIFKCKIFIYDQAPVFFLKNNSLINIIKNFEKKFIFLFFSNKWYSTISNFDDSNNFNIPFVVKSKKNFLPLKKKFKILTIGKYQKRKDHILLIKVINKLLKKGHNIELTIVGEENNFENKLIFNKLSFFIKTNNLTNCIFLIKNVPHNKIEGFYKNCHLFVLPSYDEPASISILEAQGYSKPVICSDTCGTKIYINKNCGRIFKSKNLKSLENSILYFIYRKNIFHYFSINSYKNSLKNFSKEIFNKKFLKLLNK